MDPFLERPTPRWSVSRQILGGRFRFRTDSEALLGLVDAAYGGLPEHRMGPNAPEFQIELRLLPRPAPAATTTEPPPVVMQSGGGVICGVMDAANYVVLSPAQRQGLVVASDDMLANSYHLRYELIEFAVFVLVTRALKLMPLHAACVGRRGRGVLLLGASGAGKSTLALCSLLHGLDFLAEDAVFVHPQTLLATGVANFVHLQSDALNFVDDHAVRRWIANAPVIRRRSGVQKYEADLRQGRASLAPTALTLTGVVFVSSESAADPEILLSLISPEHLAERLRIDQPYAASQAGWAQFARRLSRLDAYDLRRGAHPRAAVDALQRLLA